MADQLDVVLMSGKVSVMSIVSLVWTLEIGPLPIRIAVDVLKLQMAQLPPNDLNRTTSNQSLIRGSN